MRLSPPRARASTPPLGRCQPGRAPGHRRRPRRPPPAAATDRSLVQGGRGARRRPRPPGGPVAPGVRRGGPARRPRGPAHGPAPPTGLPGGPRRCMPSAVLGLGQDPTPRPGRLAYRTLPPSPPPGGWPILISQPRWVRLPSAGFVRAVDLHLDLQRRVAAGGHLLRPALRTLLHAVDGLRAPAAAVGDVVPTPWVTAVRIEPHAHQ